MAGIFGVVRRTPHASVQTTLADLCREPGDAGRPLLREELVDRQYQWAIARLHHGVLQPSPQLKPGTPIQVLIHGDLQNEQGLRASLGPEVPAHDTAGVVRAHYQNRGIDVGRHLRGPLSVAILDETARTLTIITDPIGSYPVYWALGPGGFLFASEVRAILRTGEVDRELDPGAVGDYLTFGFPFGNKTLARGVELVPPGSTLTYRWDTGTVATSRYATLADAFRPWPGTKEAYLDELAGCFHAAVERSFQGDHAFGLSLSGGMDSRAILSTINGRGPALTTYTLGVAGCADQVIADRLAALAGTQHRFFELDDRYLSDFLPNFERMVGMTDGMYLSHGLTEVLALNFLRQTGVDVLLRGHGGEIAKASLAWPLHTDARIHAMTTHGEFVPYLLKRVNYISPGVDLQSLFTSEWAGRVEGAARASLESSIGETDLSPSDLCGYVYLMEHHRRFTVASLELFRHAVEIRMPFVDEDFLRLLFRAPAAWRDGLEIHRRLASVRPDLLRVRNSNTGVSGSASPLVEAAFDKVNTLFKRLNVRGYRHYHNFDAWMRERLLESVQSILLDRRTLERGIFREDGLRRIIDDTRKGAADRANLLQVLLIVELWQRQNL